jgi:hypothetical protein
MQDSLLPGHRGHDAEKKTVCHATVGRFLCDPSRFGFVTIGFGRDTTMTVSLYGLKGANLTPQINFKQRLKKCLAKLGLCLVSR